MADEQEYRGSELWKTVAKLDKRLTAIEAHLREEREDKSEAKGNVKYVLSALGATLIFLYTEGKDFISRRENEEHRQQATFEQLKTDIEGYELKIVELEMQMQFLAGGVKMVGDDQEKQKMELLNRLLERIGKQDE